MKTRHRNRAFCASFAAVGLALLAAAALPQAAQAQSSAVAVLQSEITHVKAAIIRIDELLVRMDDKFTKRFERMDARFERMDQTIAEIKETAARTDERINGLQAQSNLIVTVLVAVLVPLHLATLAALFALLTKGTYWGRERASGASAAPNAGDMPRRTEGGRERASGASAGAHRGGAAQPVATPA